MLKAQSELSQEYLLLHDRLPLGNLPSAISGLQWTSNFYVPRILYFFIREFILQLFFLYPTIAFWVCKER